MDGKRIGVFVVSLGVVAILLVMGVRALKAPAEPSRGSGGHEHGVAHLNVAVDGADLYLEFLSPAANIVGFEHLPRTEAQRTAVPEAIQTLEDGESLFVPSPGAQCKLGGATVDTDIDDDPGSGSEGTDPHEHEEADEHQSHSEFTAEYRFVCEHPDELTGVDVMLFRAFPGIEHIGVLLLIGPEQGALDLTGENNRISF